MWRHSEGGGGLQPAQQLLTVAAGGSLLLLTTLRTPAHPCKSHRLTLAQWLACPPYSSVVDLFMFQFLVPMLLQVLAIILSIYF